MWKLLRIALLLLMALFVLIAADDTNTSAAITNAPVHTTANRQETVEIQPAADTFVASDRPQDSFYDDIILEVTNVPTAGTVSRRHALLRFDLSTIPQGAIIEKAELGLFQREAQGAWSLDINIVLTDWVAETANWDSRPRTAPYYSGLSSSIQTSQIERFDVTALVQDWFYNPQIDNLGLEIEGPTSNQSVLRRFDSSEASSPPTLLVTYTLPPDLADLAFARGTIDIDGVCDTSGEYAASVAYRYADVDDRIYSIYMVHDSNYLYVCAQGANGIEPIRHFALHFDTDDGREDEPDFDDIAFQVDVANGQTTVLRGNGVANGAYEPAKFSDVSTAAVPGQASPEAVEYQISVEELGLPTACGAPFGIALFHQSVMTPDDSAGWTDSADIISPATWLRAHLRPERNTICVCESATPICVPAQGATLYRLSDQAGFATDSNGLVLDGGDIAIGDTIWATQVVSTTDRHQLYDTSGDPIQLAQSSYGPTPPGIFKLVVDNAKPLMIHDLHISTQWNLEGTPQYKQLLASRIQNASDVLYDATDGQFALGDVMVNQSYDNWFDADVWLYADNNLRPAAYPGGNLTQQAADPDNPDVVYRPGQIYIGSHWNRYNLPPGQPLPQPVDVSTDWERALAHEWGHYFFFLFDTYINLIDKKAVQTDTCTGSLMGWAYFDQQTEFVFDQDHWDTNCGQTVANQLLQRHEWATASLWWPWLVLPTTLDTGPASPPMDFTNVTFVPPADGTAPLANQVYQLGYQDGESASPEARTYVFRNDRAFSNAKPAEGTTQVELIGAQPGDRLCAMDLNDNSEGMSSPRYQFGCEILAVGDNHLLLEKDTSWAPVIEIDPLSGSDFVINVQQPLPPGVDLKARIYPEHLPGSTSIDLAGSAGIYSGTANLPAFTPAAFVQVWVDETDNATDKRRESIIDFGVAKGGEPGPSSGMEQAPVYSSSGLFYYLVASLVELGPGEFVAIQSTAGTQSLPPEARPIVQGYRLIAYPPERVNTGAINILYPLESIQPLSHVGAASTNGGELRVYFWDGETWTALDTVLSQTQNGYGLASAESQGVGTYILTEINGGYLNFVPFIRN